MGSLTFDFLTESFLFSEDLIAEQFASIPDHDLEQELQRYRAFCISNEKSLLSEVRSHPSNLRVFSGLDRVSLDQLSRVRSMLNNTLLTTRSCYLPPEIPILAKP